jgi:hypothetical protein
MPRSRQLDAEQILVALGRDLDPLEAAALAYSAMSAGEKRVLRAVLADATPESRRRASDRLAGVR